MHFMNPQRGAHLRPPAAVRPPAPAPGGPAALPGGPQSDPGGDLTVTLTKMADGTVTCDAGDGNPQPYGSVEEALDAAKEILEPGGEEEMGDEGAIPGAGEGGQ